MTNVPLKTIGNYIGNRDHTTIMHGIEKIEKEMTQSPTTQKAIDIIKKKIQPGK